MTDRWELSGEIRDGEKVSDETLIKLISDYYDDNPTGGNAHIIFDEESYSDHLIWFCIQCSVLDGDWVCAGLLMELLKRHPKFREAIVKAKLSDIIS